MDIKVTYSTLDRFRKTRSFKTLAGAQKFAQHWVGQTPEVSTSWGYAVSGDGMGKVTVRGANILDLFPKLASSDADSDSYRDSEP